MSSLETTPPKSDAKIDAKSDAKNGSRNDAKSDVRFVLVAEDDDDIRHMIRDSICREANAFPIQVIEAKDGVEALNETAHRQFHCVVTDLKMPKSTGDDFIRKMQGQALNANTPTLVVSAYAEDEFKKFCDIYSHIRVIPKPFEPTTVAQAVIREVKLGRLDDRIAIHLMNPFLRTIIAFVNDELKLKNSVETPVLKKPGVAPNGDYHCTITLTTGMVKARFTLSFAKNFVEWSKVNYYKNRVSEQASLTNEDVARYLVQSFFEKGAAGFQACMGGMPRLGGMSIVTARNENGLNDLKVTNGVVVQITSERGYIFAGALSSPKTRRI